MKRKPKILLLLVLIFSLVFGSVAMASDTIDIMCDDATYTMPAISDIVGDKEYMIFTYTEVEGAYSLVVAENGAKFCVSEYDVVAYDVDNVRCSLNTYRINKEGEWARWSDVSIGITWDKVIYSTVDVYDADTDVVFFRAPKVGILSPVVRKITLTGALTQVVLLIPLVTLVIVSYLALRKALNFLLVRLRRS